MVIDLDIYRTANEYIKRYSENAAVHAAMRADELLAKGDLNGQRVWIRIIAATD